jgi:hypothetical protein
LTRPTGRGHLNQLIELLHLGTDERLTRGGKSDSAFQLLLQRQLGKIYQSKSKKSQFNKKNRIIRRPLYTGTEFSKLLPITPMVTVPTFYLRISSSVGDPDQYPDPYVFGPPGSDSHKYGYGSGSFHHRGAKKEKPSFLLFCNFFMNFYL